MLVNLPPEVILNTSCYLTFNDKLSLIRTCKKLHSIISQWNLYEQLTIAPANANVKTRDIVRKFKNHTLNGAQVKRLQLDLSQLSNQLYRRLPSVFPNLTELLDATRNEGVRNDFILQPLSTWKETLQRYDMEESGYLEITKLFDKYTFTALTQLNITTRIGIHKIDIQRLFKRMPFLRQLRLYWIIINGLAFFQDLHKDCQYLNSLTLESTVIDINEFSLPASIDPIHTFKTLRLEESTVVFDRNLLLFDYIVAKYPKLTQIDLLFTYERQKLEPFIQHNSSTFNETTQELTVRRDNFAKTQALYEETGANRLLSRLPASITSIGLNTKLFKHALESLQQTRLFESLQVLQLVDKNASPSFVFKTEIDFECFYRLGSIKVLSVGVSVNIKNYQDNMNVLTGAQKVDLVIIKDLDISDIAMDWLLSTFPNVKEFNIINSQVQIQTLRLIKTRSYPSLNTFNIKKGEIQDNFFSFMRILTPNIRHLGSVVQGDAYQYRIPWHYFRDRKSAVANGTLEMFQEAPEQTCHYIDLNGYRLKSFQLFSNLYIKSVNREAKLFVEVVLPSSVTQHVYKLNQNSPATYIGLGKDYQPYMIRQMTKVMVVCTILESFQVDNTNVIAVSKSNRI